MSAGRVVHEDILQRQNAERSRREAARRCGERIAAARQWVRDNVPEAVAVGVDGEPHVVFVGAAMALREQHGRLPEPAEVLERVRRRCGWVLEELAA